MPLNVRRSYTSILLVLFGFVVIISAQAPQAAQSPAPANLIASKPPTAGEVMRERISKAKAFIAVRNYNAAIYELENIRRETSDSSVNAVANVLLMNSYLEQGDYKKAQDLLENLYKSYRANNANATVYYPAVAGQVIKGARSQAERYRSLGLAVADRNLPLEAVNDIERMREMLEIVVTQAKEVSSDKAKTQTGVALLEEATNSRALLARDDYDARRWKDALGDSREQMANSRSVIINAVDGKPVETDTPQNTVAANTTEPSAQKLPATDTNTRPPETLIAANNPKPVVEPPAPADEKKTEIVRPVRIVGNPPKETLEVKKETPPTASEPKKSSGPLEVGSLIAFATKQPPPIYPVTARSIRATGVVRVEIVVNETGDVTEIQKTSGNALLQSAARDAIRKWKFKPFVVDGQPVRATGFVNFNFSL
ncbi:MAG: TonB family protein [Blastocatellia bacterium]